MSEQRDMIRDQARRFVVKQAHADDLWSGLVGLGWMELDLAEDLDTICILAEELGRELAPAPFVWAHLAQALLAADPDHRAEARRAAAGKCRAVAAWSPSPTEARVAARVVGGMTADVVVVAGPHGVSRGTPVDRTEVQRIDGRPCALVRLEGPTPVNVDPTDAIERARIVLSARMLGSASRVFEDTIDYLKTRVQFGVPIGSFQALQHRAARLHVELVTARSAVYGAVRAAESGEVSLLEAASLAKASVGDTALHVAKEAIQMHGGIGVTAEHHVGRYLQDVWCASQTLGDASFHRDRWATARGY